MHRASHVILKTGIFVCLAANFVLGGQQAAVSITADSRSIQPGELVVLTMTTAMPVPSIHVHAFDRELMPWRVDDRTWRVLVGIDLDVAAGPHPVSIDAGASPDVSRTTYPLVVRAKRFPTRTLTVDGAFVNPPASVNERIAAEAAVLERLWRVSSPVQAWPSGFVRPVPDPANSAFGTRSIYNGQPRGAHGGADFSSAAGTPVKAPNGGRVAIARDLYFTGNTVIIDHGLGMFSTFAHLSAIDVHEGDMAAAGQPIGRVGATGRVTGPHLHWGVRLNGARVDPLSILAILGRPAATKMSP